jgi:hypothetical protein
MKTRNLIMTLILLIGVIACVNARTNNNKIIIVNETTHDTMTVRTKNGFYMLDTVYVYKVIDKK